MQRRRWEDYSVGQRFLTPAVTVTETHIVNWAALTGDWYPLHTDEEWSKVNSSFKERVAHGPLIFGLAVGLVAMADILGDSVLAWLGVDKLRALAPVRIGDTVKVEPEVTEHRASSKPDRGITVLKYQVTNQKSEKVMEFEFALLMRRAEV